jgi:hypothetical protein
VEVFSPRFPGFPAGRARFSFGECPVSRIRRGRHSSALEPPCEYKMRVFTQKVGSSKKLGRAKSWAEQKVGSVKKLGRSKSWVGGKVGSSGSGPRPSWVDKKRIGKLSFLPEQKPDALSGRGAARKGVAVGTFGDLRALSPWGQFLARKTEFLGRAQL